MLDDILFYGGEKEMYDLVINIIGGLICAMILFLLTKLFLGWKNYPGIKRMYRIAREYTKAGGINFFSSRQAYIKFKDHGTASNYLSKAESNIIYVGFWLAHSVEIGNVIETIKSLLETGKKVVIVLIDPDSDIINYCSKFLGLNNIEIKNRIVNSIRKFCCMYDNLSIEAKKRFTLKLHSVPISASAFLIDNELNYGKTLVDFKLYNYCRDDGFGMEFHKKGYPLYDKFTKSYKAIAEEAKEIDYQKYFENIIG